MLRRALGLGCRLGGLRCGAAASPMLFRSPLGVAQFHRAGGLLADATAGTTARGPVIDKENPLYAPDNQETWRNVGYDNLAPLGWKEWDDLPAPYKYYEVKVDPKDVEKEGLLWQLFTNWKTALPITGIIAIPFFAFDVFIIDVHTELMFIFWATIAVFNHSFGGMLKSGLESSIQDIRSQLYGAETKYLDALQANLSTHRKAMHVVEYLQMLNAGERSLRALEAEALTRNVKISERNKMAAMLDYMVLIRSQRAAAMKESTVVSARTNVEKRLADSATQQRTIADAISSLQSSKLSSDFVDEIFDQSYAAAIAEAEKAGASVGTWDAVQRDLFNKRFDIQDVITESMVAEAKSKPAEWTVLTARCGGTEPKAGSRVVVKSPIDY